MEKGSSVLGHGEEGHWIGTTERKFWHRPGPKLSCKAMMMVMMMMMMINKEILKFSKTESKCLRATGT